MARCCCCPSPGLGQTRCSVLFSPISYPLTIYCSRGEGCWLRAHAKWKVLFKGLGPISLIPNCCRSGITSRRGISSSCSSLPYATTSTIRPTENVACWGPDYWLLNRRWRRVWPVRRRRRRLPTTTKRERENDGVREICCLPAFFERQEY